MRPAQRGHNYTVHKYVGHNYTGHNYIGADSKSTSRKIFDKPNFDILMLIPISELPIASNSQRGVDPVSLRLGLANNKANGGEKRQRGLFDRGKIAAKSK